MLQRLIEHRDNNKLLQPTSKAPVYEKLKRTCYSEAAMFAHEVEEGGHDVAEAGDDAELGHGQHKRLLVLLAELHAAVDAVLEQQEQVLLGRLGDVARQACDPRAHVRSPPKVNGIL